MKADCHVHLDKIGGSHKTPPATPEQFWEYAEQEQISTAFVIYEYDDTLRAFHKEGVRFVPLYWVRDPLRPAVPSSAVGIKLHPYIERYQLSLENTGPTLDLARQRGLFVFIHMDDRILDCSRGKLVEPLAAAYPDVRFVMAHSGAYAPPRRDCPTSSWTPDEVIRELVTEAVEVAAKHDNVFLETSILASEVKTRILARAPVEKLLLGSDFPILAASPWASVRFQEDALAQHGLSQEDLARIHANAHIFATTLR